MLDIEDVDNAVNIFYSYLYELIDFSKPLSGST